MGNLDWCMVGFLLLALAERTYERRYSQRAMRGVRRMEWSYRVLHSLHIVIYAATAAEYFLSRRQLFWPLTIVALVMFALSVVIRLTAIRTLGRFWSLQLEIRQQHRLVREGIYRYVRHPAYLAIMMEVLAVPLVANSYFTAALALAAYVPVLLMRWRREEREMIQQIGPEYEQYRREVPAFLPRRLPAKRRETVMAER